MKKFKLFLRIDSNLRKDAALFFETNYDDAWDIADRIADSMFPGSLLNMEEIEEEPSSIKLLAEEVERLQKETIELKESLEQRIEELETHRLINLL